MPNFLFLPALFLPFSTNLTAHSCTTQCLSEVSPIKFCGTYCTISLYTIAAWAYFVKGPQGVLAIWRACQNNLRRGWQKSSCQHKVATVLLRLIINRQKLYVSWLLKDKFNLVLVNICEREAFRDWSNGLGFWRHKDSEIKKGGWEGTYVWKKMKQCAYMGVCKMG